MRQGARVAGAGRRLIFPGGTPGVHRRGAARSVTAARMGGILHFRWTAIFLRGARRPGAGDQYHRTLTDFLRTLLQNGFAICDMAEPQPPAEMMGEARYGRNEMRRPMMLIVAARAVARGAGTRGKASGKHTPAGQKPARGCYEKKAKAVTGRLLGHLPAAEYAQDLFWIALFQQLAGREQTARRAGTSRHAVGASTSRDAQRCAGTASTRSHDVGVVVAGEQARPEAEECRAPMAPRRWPAARRARPPDTRMWVGEALTARPRR